LTIRYAAAWLRPAIPAPITATEICCGMNFPFRVVKTLNQWSPGMRA
jgi:hypothetical protein